MAKQGKWATKLPDGAPRGAVVYQEKAGQPTLAELQAAQHAAAPAFTRCASRTGATRPEGYGADVAFAADGSVAWTSWDRDGSPEGQCRAAALRDHMHVSPISGASPVVVGFPLPQTRW